MAYRSVPMSGFYPLYDGANDQVDPVAPVARAAFQQIIPRYELSSSETRDTGLGPAFYEVPVWGPRATERNDGDLPARQTRQAVAAAAARRSPAPLHHWQGTMVDLYA